MNAHFRPEQVTQLPNPEHFSALDREAMAALISVIRSRIVEDGAISFAEYMELALYAPGLGYYVRDDHGLGAHGDFVTAPEMSRAFGCCIANQCQEVLAQTGGGIVEIGAGTGKLAVDILEALGPQQWPEHYTIVEKSPALRTRQAQMLDALPQALRARIFWADAVPNTDGIIVANEVLDALAVQRFIIRDDAIHELGVGLVEERLGWVELPASAELLAWWSDLKQTLPEPLPSGYVSERCAGLDEFLRVSTASLGRGIALLLDYGYPRHEYFHRERGDGTLLCHLAQRSHGDPFYAPGLQDITASVDFTAVAESAATLGLDVAGYTTQAWFLMSTGIDAALASFSQADHNAGLLEVQAAKRLLLPGEMGERIQAIALAKDYDAPLMGWRLRDTMARLRMRELGHGVSC